MKPTHSDLFRKYRSAFIDGLRKTKVALRFLWIVTSSAFPWPCLVYSLWKFIELLGAIATASAAPNHGQSPTSTFDIIPWAFAVAYTAVHTRHDWHDAWHRLRQLIRSVTEGYVVVRRFADKLTRATAAAHCTTLNTLRAWWQKKQND